MNFSPLSTANANQSNESVTCAHVAGMEVCARVTGENLFGGQPYLENSWFGTGRAQMQIVILVPRLNILGTRPQLFCVVAHSVCE